MPSPWATVPDPIVLTAFDGVYARTGLVANWLQSVRRVGLGAHVVLCALDAEAEAFGEHAAAVTMRGDRFEDGASPQIARYHAPGFRRVALAKLDAVHRLLAEGRTVLFSDADIVFLKDPRPHLVAQDADVVAQSDVRPGRNLSRPKRPWDRFKPLRRRLGSTLCSGFLRVRPTPATLRAFDTSRPGTGRYASDQPLLHDRLVWRGEASLALLPDDTFPNGAHLAHRRWRHGDKALDDAVLVHVNWCEADRKVPLLRELGLWTVGDPVGADA